MGWCTLERRSVKLEAVHMLIYMHTCMNTCIHTYKHTYIHTYIHIYMYTQNIEEWRIREMKRLELETMYMLTYIHTYIHTCIYTYIHTYMHTLFRSGVYVRKKGSSWKLFSEIGRKVCARPPVYVYVYVCLCMSVYVCISNLISKKT